MRFFKLKFQAVLAAMLGVFMMLAAPVLADGYSLEIVIENGPAQSDVMLPLFLVASGTKENYTISSDFEDFAKELQKTDLNQAEEAEDLAEFLEMYTEGLILDPNESKAISGSSVTFENLMPGLYFIPSVEYRETTGEVVETESVVLWLDSNQVVNPKEVDPALEEVPAEEQIEEIEFTYDGDPADAQKILDEAGSSEQDRFVETELNPLDDPMAMELINTAAHNQTMNFVLIFAGAALLSGLVFFILHRRHERAHHHH